MESDRVERTQLLLRRSDELQREYDDLVRSLNAAYDSVRSINAALAENRSESRQLFQDLIAIVPAAAPLGRLSSLRSNSDAHGVKIHGDARRALQGQGNHTVTSMSDASNDTDSNALPRGRSSNSTAERIWAAAQVHSRISSSRATGDHQQSLVSGDVVTPDLLRNNNAVQSNDNSISVEGVPTVFYSGEQSHDNCNVIYFPSNVRSADEPICDQFDDGDDDHSYAVNDASGDSSALAGENGDGYVLHSKSDPSLLGVNSVIQTAHNVDLRLVKTEPAYESSDMHNSFASNSQGGTTFRRRMNSTSASKTIEALNRKIANIRMRSKEVIDERTRLKREQTRDRMRRWRAKQRAIRERQQMLMSAMTKSKTEER